MTENNNTCPICQIPLVNGKCKECGYYVDDVIMPNQRRDYYTQRRPQKPPQSSQPRQQASSYQNTTYSRPMPDMNSSYQAPDNSEDFSVVAKIGMIAVALVGNFIGIILGSVLLKLPNINEKKKNFGKIILILGILSFLAQFFLPLIPIFFNSIY